MTKGISDMTNVRVVVPRSQGKGGVGTVATNRKQKKIISKTVYSPP